MNGNSKSFSNWEGEAFEKMLFDYIDNGYLESIVTFFEHEPEQLSLIPKMLSDERLRLKIGAFAIIEELKEKNNEALKFIIPYLIELLNSSEKNIRGDAAYALEIIADVTAKPALIEALNKEQDPQVKELIEDALKKLK
ncbi:MAG: HEAT repeat domain-containing protein [Thermodesulfovibrio sp.]|nr:HEAT repeat domain-containing protein [Thermodesulfovibrio sp.]